MTNYITYREEDSDGLLCYYILQKAFPHYCAIISYGKLSDRLASVPVAGYNLYVNFNGTLRGNVIPSYNDVLDEINLVLEDMALWFLSNRVVNDYKKYSKFKI